MLEFQYRNIKQCKLYIGNFVYLESSFLEFSSLETSYLEFSSLELSFLEFSYLLEVFSYCINIHAIMQLNHVDQVDLNLSLLFILSYVEVFDLAE